MLNLDLKVDKQLDGYYGRRTARDERLKREKKEAFRHSIITKVVGSLITAVIITILAAMFS